MSQDSCEDEEEGPLPPVTAIKTPDGPRPPDVAEGHEKPSKYSRLRMLTYLNVLFNGILAVTTFLLMIIAYRQLQSSHLDQRAWVGMKEMKMANLSGDAPIRIDVKLTNSGKTPAFDVNLTVNVFVRAPGLMTGMDELTKRVRRDHPVIFPGSDTYEIVEGESRPSQEELDSIKTGKNVLYVVGEIDYRDGFREYHITEFCGFYRPERGVFHSCSEHQRAS